MSEAKQMEVLMDEKRTFPPSKDFSEKAHVKSMAEYEALYKRSIEDPEGFWGEMADKNLTWYKKWDKVLDYDFNKPSQFFITQAGPNSQREEFSLGFSQ